MKYTLSQIAKIVNASPESHFIPEQIAENILTDSRTYNIQPNSIFFAINGKNHDGHKFIPELYQKGVNIFVISKPQNFAKVPNFGKVLSLLIVDDVVDALQKLAIYHRQQFDIPLVAVTGSNGKTVVKDWLFQIFGHKQNTLKNPKSYNSQIGVPLSVLLLNKNHQLAIFEAGISQTGEMQKLEKIISPQIGIFTNIGDAHQENFETKPQKIREKLQLFQNCEKIIYCKDHQAIHAEIQNCPKLANAQKFSWSAKKEADLKIIQIKKHDSKTEIFGIFKKQKIKIKIPFTDDASIENSIQVLAFGLAFYGEKIVSEIDFLQLQPTEMRLEQKAGINNCTIINDSYNCDLASLKIALDYLKHQKQNQQKTIILSDLQEVGVAPNLLYKQIAEILEQNKISQIVGIGKEISQNRHFFGMKKQFFQSTKEFLNSSKINFSDQTILLKGARIFQFEDIAKKLQKQNHITVLEVNLQAIIQNLNYFRSFLKQETKTMVMVKAFSYGSGTYEIANILQHHRVDYLGVAYADEGIELRKNGISTPIMVMNPASDNFRTFLKYNLEPEIYSFSILKKYYEGLKNSSAQKIPIHIKIDSGMNRLGFQEDEVNKLIYYLKENSRLQIKSVFSHLVGSSEKEHDNFTHKQVKNFEKCSEKIIKNFEQPIIRHILNSGGVERFPEFQFDMVRLGIGLYGISAKNSENVQNIAVFKSRISQIKNVKAGETIGYSRVGKVLINSKIAIVPVGYADGLNRLLSDRVGEVFVAGKYFVPIIGNICMDMCMLDITGLPVQENDEVEIFGNNISITQLAETLQTIPYEILTSISQRVKRVYVSE